MPSEDVVHVPWVIWWPGHLKASQRIDSPCSQLDVTPTLLRLVGFDIAEAGFDGRDALGPIGDDRRVFFSSWHADGPIGFVHGNRKVVYQPYVDDMLEYDLRADPDEVSSRAISSPQAERVRRRIRAWQEGTQMHIDARRFRQRRVYSHWQTFCAGRSAWAYYVP